MCSSLSHVWQLGFSGTKQIHFTFLMKRCFLRKPSCCGSFFLAVRFGLPRWHNDKESSWQCWRCRRRGFDPWVGKIPWRRKWQLTPVFLPGKSHGERSLVGCSSWGCKKSDKTERLSRHVLRGPFTFCELYRSFPVMSDLIPLNAFWGFKIVVWTTGRVHACVC